MQNFASNFVKHFIFTVHHFQVIDTKLAENINIQPLRQAGRGSDRRKREPTLSRKSTALGATEVLEPHEGGRGLKGGSSREDDDTPKHEKPQILRAGRGFEDTATQDFDLRDSISFISEEAYLVTRMRIDATFSISLKVTI